MKIGEIVARTHLSAHTLRYYERIGLLPRIFRDASRQRDYDASILPWIEFISRLKETGMPIREMVCYADLRAKGPVSEPARRALLVRHRERVRVHLAELRACLSVLDDKIAGYAERSEKERHHDAEQKRTIRGGLAGPS